MTDEATPREVGLSEGLGLWCRSERTVMSIDELRELCALTVELTKLRQAECKHLCIENFAPELLGKLIRERMALGNPATLPSQPAPVWVQPVIVQPQWVPQPAWAPPWTIACGGAQ